MALRNILQLVSTALLIFLLSCSGNKPSEPLPEPVGWVNQVSPVKGVALQAVDFVDHLNGWIVGDNGLILNTVDGGVKWIEQNSGTDNYLWDLDFIDTLNGWAVGYNGTILTTNDGGITWNQQYSSTTSRLLEVTFLDSQNGWIAGWYSSVFLRTTDGGQHWIKDTIGNIERLSNLSFTSDSNGLAIFDLEKVISTNDGGSSWTVLSEDPSLLIWGMSFLDRERGLIVSTKYETFEGHTSWYNKVFETANGGKNWSLIYRSLGGTMTSGKVFFLEQTCVFVIGSQYIHYSSDGGLSWATQSQNNSWNLSNATFISPDVGWAVGMNGLILHTTSGGMLP